jgi:hypothetical protein
MSAAEGQAATQARAQNIQQDESPFRKFIAIAQARILSLYFRIPLSLPYIQQILLVYVVTQFGTHSWITFSRLELTWT